MVDTISITLFVIMANTKIKLFHFLQKIYGQSGIRPSQSNHNFKSLNLKYLFVLFVIIQFSITSLAYFIFKAKSIGQLADSFYMFLSAVAGVAFLTIMNSKIDDIHKLIENFEAFIQKSKVFSETKS